MALQQVVLTRRPDGGIKVTEMGLGQSGMGETLREHMLQPGMSAGLVAHYLVSLIEKLEPAQ